MDMEHYRKEIASQFVKVGNGMYLAKDDPHFLEKYVKYFPQDGEKLYEYAMQLEKRAKWKEAIVVYKKAIKQGYLAADARIAVIKNLSTSYKPANEVKKKKSLFLPLLFGFINVCLLTGLLLFLFNYLQGSLDPLSINTNGEGEEHEQQEQSFNCMDCKNLKNYPLPITVIENALKRYKQATGRYPKDISSLVGEGKNGSNWISYIPNGVFLENANTSYSLMWNDTMYKKSGEILELHYYPEARELAVVKEDSILATYKVAVGEKPLPFEQSKVMERIVNPNGGNSPLGTRGLVLHDNYAIHGTDTPQEIGKRVTLGCLRLRNEDIEILYPYISLGTPFLVRSGKPVDAPLYKKGLPPLYGTDLTLYENETQPNRVFRWKF